MYISTLLKVNLLNTPFSLLPPPRLGEMPHTRSGGRPLQHPAPSLLLVGVLRRRSEASGSGALSAPAAYPGPRGVPFTRSGDLRDRARRRRRRQWARLPAAGPRVRLLPGIFPVRGPRDLQDAGRGRAVRGGQAEGNQIWGRLSAL